MLTGLPVLEKTDWSRLYHAYGRATDTPDHLLALLTEEPELRQEALSHLWAAIMHQGTPWTATGPVALVIAGLLYDDRIDRGGESIRAGLFAFLVSVAEAAAYSGESLEELERIASSYDLDTLIDAGNDEALYEEQAGEAFYARSILGCIKVAPVLMRVMLEGLADADPRVRAHAAMGAAVLAKSGLMRDSAPELESQLMTLARSTQDADERSAHVLALGDLGFSPVDFLDDPSPAVRMCAALAPGLATDPAAISELLTTLKDHAGSIDGWFGNPPPQFPMRPRFAVVARLVEQVTEFERLVEAAEAVVGVTLKYCVDFDWGPLLAAAFTDGSGIVQTEAQGRFLRALVNREELWDPTFGNADRWFKKAGLPYDRQACAQRVRNISR